MTKKIKNSRLLNILIPCAITLFVACAAFALFVTPSKFIKILFTIFLIIQLILGFLICVLSLKITRRATHLFIGALIFLSGVLRLIPQFLPAADSEKLWSVYPIIAGIALFISGFYKYKKIKFGYFIPSAAIFFMGVLFSLFAFGVVKESFVKFFFFFGAIFFALATISLISLFFLQRKYKKFVILDDETGTFSDEEGSFMDMDNDDEK